MTTIYTTQRCFQVEETYETIAEYLNRSEQLLLEVTEIVINHSDYPDFNTETVKRKVLIQKQYIVEVVGQ